MKYLKTYEKWDKFKEGDLVKFVKIPTHLKNKNYNDIYKIEKVNKGTGKHPPTFTLYTLNGKLFNMTYYSSIRHITELEKDTLKYNL